MNNFLQSLTSYLDEKKYEKISIKAVLFDMDGVLYNSMPNHAKSWTKVMNAHNLHLTEEEAYMHEGRTGADTIGIICKRQGVAVSDEEIKDIYREKTLAFNSCSHVEPMAGSYDLLQKVVRDGYFPMLVTGSGQPSLLDRLNHDFPNMFSRDKMVTSFDVKYGKPNPEPYLTALKKGNLKPCEAIVVENAPLGVEAAHAAGIFTIAANTGPLSDSLLLDSGADVLYPSMQSLCDDWDNIIKMLKS